MTELQVTVLQVAVRNTSNGKTIYDVQCGDGETRQVWEAPLANAINVFSNTGQAITIREDAKQNGQWLNRTIVAFAPPGQALPASTGQGGGQRGGGGGGYKGMSEEDKTRIAKMGAQGSAATIVGALFQGAGPEALEEAVDKFESLAIRIYKTARSHEKPATTVLQTGTQGQIVPTGGNASTVLPVAGQPVDAAALAAAVPGVALGVGGVAENQDAAAEGAQTAPADDINWN